MAISTEKRITVLDYLRTFIGDEDRLLFTDDELDAELRGVVWPSIFTEQLKAMKNHFYSLSPCPVIDMEISSGTSGSMYRIDESTKQVHWISGTSPPSDNDQIEVTYLNLDYFKAVQNTLLIIATDRARLTVRSKVGDIETDTRSVRKELMDQIYAIGSYKYWNQL